MQIKSPPMIALLHWGNLIEDFLDSINVSFESFCQEMTGGWLFGYIDALKLVGVNTVLFCISGKVDEPTYYTHIPTGARICVLPVPKIYHSLRFPLINPYGWTFQDAAGSVTGFRRLQLEFYRHTLPYLATPLRLLKRELQKENCQAIICQEYEYARFDVCVLLGKLIGIPVFATFQGGSFQLSYWERYFRPWTIKTCAGLIIPSQIEIERVESKYCIPNTKIARIFNPINLQDWKLIKRNEARKQLDLPLESQVIVWHGRIDIHRKGLDTLLDAWQKLCDNNPEKDLVLMLVGTGSDADKFRDRIKKMQLKGIIWKNEYIRDRKYLNLHLCAADVYTLPSRHEGFPVAPIEAMACGLTIVATDVPGIKDILSGSSFNNSYGVVVPKKNANALAQAWERVFEEQNRYLQQNQTDSGNHNQRLLVRSYVEQNFSLASIGKQLKNLLDR